MERNSSVPLYYQIVTKIKKQIDEGKLKYGDKIPTEKWMCEHFKVSRVTVRKCLDELIEEGYVERRPSKGTFVIQQKFNKDFSRLKSMHQELVDAGIVPTSKIMSYKLELATPSMIRHLECSEKDTIIVIDRIRYADERPFAEQRLLLPLNIFPDFDPWLLTDHSLHDMMENDYHLAIDHTTQSFTAHMPSRTQMKKLSLPCRKPLVHVRGTVFLKDGRICEYSDSYYVTDVVRYSFTWYR